MATRAAFDCATSTFFAQRQACPSNPCNCGSDHTYWLNLSQVTHIEADIMFSHGPIEIWVGGNTWSKVAVVDGPGNTLTHISYDIPLSNITALIFSGGACSVQPDGSLRCSAVGGASGNMLDSYGYLVYGGYEPICDQTCCEGDTRQAFCDNGMGVHTEVCLCPGVCGWWDQTSCPTCEDGDQEYQTCWDGSQILVRYCDHGVWYDSGLECPPQCAEGQYCWDYGQDCPFTGTRIYTKTCVNGQCVNNSERCLYCRDVHPSSECINYRVYDCVNDRWVDTGVACGTPPPLKKGDLRIVGTCPDGSSMYEKWNGRAWVSVSCPSPRKGRK